jgi:hypothetical protein
MRCCFLERSSFTNINWIITAARILMKIMRYLNMIRRYKAELVCQIIDFEAQLSASVFMVSEDCKRLRNVSIHLLTNTASYTIPLEPSSTSSCEPQAIYYAKVVEITLHAARKEGVWRCGSIAPHILRLWTTCRLSDQLQAPLWLTPGNVPPLRVE